MRSGVSVQGLGLGFRNRQFSVGLGFIHLD